MKPTPSLRITRPTPSCLKYAPPAAKRPSYCYSVPDTHPIATHGLRREPGTSCPAQVPPVARLSANQATRVIGMGVVIPPPEAALKYCDGPSVCFVQFRHTDCLFKG